MCCVALVKTKKYLLVIGKSKCQIMVEEKSIRFGLSPSSVDQCHPDDNLCHARVPDKSIVHANDG